MSEVKIITALVCEDVRKEINNKDIVIGVFSGDIVVPEFPSFLNIAFYLELEIEEIGEHKLLFRITLGDEKPAELRVTVGGNEAGPLMAALPPIVMRIDGPTEIALQVKEGDDWKTVKRKRIVRGPMPPQIASQVLPDVSAQ